MRTLTIATVMAALTAGAAPAAAQRLESPVIASWPDGVTLNGQMVHASTQGTAPAHLDPPVITTWSPGVTWNTQPAQAAAAGAQSVEPVPVPPSAAPNRAWVSGPDHARPAPPPPPPIAAQGPRHPHGPRWGDTIDGHWRGGMQAPGGWEAYRRPVRGWLLPRYWIAPDFYIDDFGLFGLGVPPFGYHWSRYYDDAVLVDDDGRVWDSVHGLDWTMGERLADRGYGTSYDYGEYNRGYPPPPPPGPVVEYREGQPGYTRTYMAGGYVSGGYWYPPVTTTVIHITSKPVVTTTTRTEYVTSKVSKRRVYHTDKRVPTKRHRYSK